VTALDARTGETVWKTDETQRGNGEKRDDGWYIGSWCTPVLAQVNGQDQLLCTMSTRIVAYDPRDGRVLWSCQGIPHEKGDLAYSSPVVVGDICVTIGGYNGPAIGVRLGGTGDVTQKLRLWRREKSPQSIGSGVSIDGYLYRPNAGPGTIECVDPKTGEVVWTGRGGGNFWGSIIYAAGHGYATNQEGETVVFKPTPNGFELVARNPLGSPSNSTPAVSDGELFIRTADYLFCIAE
jgi:outer membrane protein assembly factor BamB